MSVQNILVPNNLDIFCDQLTAGTLNIDNEIIDNLTVDNNLNVIGTSSFTGNMSTQTSTVFNLHGAMNVSGAAASIAINSLAFIVGQSGSVVYIDSGALLDMRGTMIVNSAALVTFNNTPTFNDGIILPNNTYSLTRTYSGDSSTGSINCNFYRVGNVVNVFINGFTDGPTGAGTYSIDISSLTNYQIAIDSSSTVETNDNGNFGVGRISFLQYSQTISIQNGASLLTGNFSGTGTQGLTFSTVVSYISS
jgi:hypothetical protein